VAVILVVTAAMAQHHLFLVVPYLMLAEAVAAVTIMQPQGQVALAVVETEVHLPTLLVPPVRQTQAVAAAAAGITQ